MNEVVAKHQQVPVEAWFLTGVASVSYTHLSIGVVTALNPIIGYKNSTKIAKEALETGRSVYELVLEHGILNKMCIRDSSIRCDKCRELLPKRKFWIVI